MAFSTQMHLKVLLPFQVLLDQAGVTRVVAETRAGAFGSRPNRRDCVAALTPGIFLYTTEADGERFIAVDEGILIKAGPEVQVSVRNAVAGADLGELLQAVEQQFRRHDAQEQSVRYLLAKLESEFARRLVEYHRLG